MSWGVALRLGRVSNLPTVWTNVAAGAVLSGAALQAGPLLGLVVAASLFYVAGMYLNDAFDRRIDAVERPERPIPSGAVRASTVFAAGFTMLALGEAGVVLVAAGLHGPAGAWPASVAGLALAATIVFYDVHHKNNPLSPVVMGIARMLVYVTAGLALRPTLPFPLLAGAVALWCHLIGLTYAAKQENLTRITNVWPLVFLAVPVVWGLGLAVSQPWTLPFVVVLALWDLHALRFLFVPARRSIPGAVVRLIAGIALVDALLICGEGHPGVAVVVAAGCALTRAFQRYVPGS